MAKKSIHKNLIIVALLIFYIPCFSQTIQELEEKRKRTEQEIELTNSRLTETQKKRAENISQLNTLKKQLDLRKNLISDYEKQMKLINEEIEDKELIISGLQKDVLNLKKEYAKLIQFAWRNKSQMHILLFIFASDDFNQAYKRNKFYQQLLKFRETQGKEIIATQKILESEIISLTQQQEKIKELKIEKGIEVSKLKKEENFYTQNVKSLQKEEKKLRKEIEERKKSMEAIEKIIKDLIAEEARKTSELNRIRDARYIRITDGFKGNKGKMPWPTTSGIIISEFGEHFHPVLKEVKIRNNGIDIGTEPNSEVKSIFEGEVTKVVSIPGSNIAVIIRHGDYLSVYSNLVKVKVKVGDNVKTSQVIGEAYTEKGSKQGIINLQIWQENIIQNPKHWILP